MNGLAFVLTAFVVGGALGYAVRSIIALAYWQKDAAEMLEEWQKIRNEWNDVTKLANKTAQSYAEAQAELDAVRNLHQCAEDSAIKAAEMNAWSTQTVAKIKALAEVWSIRCPN